MSNVEEIDAPTEAPQRVREVQAGDLTAQRTPVPTGPDGSRWPAGRRRLSPSMVVHSDIHAHGQPRGAGKGVDVQLALDAVLAGFDQSCDTVIIASCDTDLAPAVEALLRLKDKQGSPDVELIAWKGRANKIGLPDRQLTYRWVGDIDYKAVQELTDYNR